MKWRGPGRCLSLAGGAANVTQELSATFDFLGKGFRAGKGLRFEPLFWRTVTFGRQGLERENSGMPGSVSLSLRDLEIPLGGRDQLVAHHDAQDLDINSTVVSVLAE